MYLKKGAMFGLDARIALAIFGTLSVISGAALYSAIKESRAISVANRIIEVGKGLESYILDTGMAPVMLDTINLDATELISSSVNGWQGPYLSNTMDGQLIVDEGTPKFEYFIHRSESAGLGGNAGSSFSNGNACSSKTDCYYWLKTHVLNSSGGISSSSRSIALALDEKIDNGDGLDKGKVRVNWFDVGETNAIIFYQVMPSLN